MKKTLLFLLLALFIQSVHAKKFNFKLTNTTTVPVQVSAQILRGLQKDNPDFLFVLQPNESKIFNYKLKKNEKIKFIGLGGGIETLPLVKPFSQLNSSEQNDYQLVIPILDKINALGLNDVIAQLKTDNILKILIDSTKYVKDEMPPLGTFLFVNKKHNTVLPLTATSWKNETLIRRIDNQNSNITNFINSLDAGKFNLSGVPFLSKLSTTFNSSNIVEVIWDIQNAHIQQWQPADKNVFQILQDPNNNSFITSCKEEIREKNLAGGDYQLLFISAAYVVDKITISGREYNKVALDAFADYRLPNPGLEVIQPIGLDAGYNFTRSKSFLNINSGSNIYLRFLAQDYTPALNSYLTQQERSALKNSAVNKLTTLKNTIQIQYAAIQAVDSSLIKSESIDIIMPIVLSTPELSLKAEIFNNEGANITSPDDKNYNSKARQYNSILNTLKDNVEKYKSTIESIEKLNQQVLTDFQKSLNLTQSIELDKKIIQGYADSMRK